MKYACKVVRDDKDIVLVFPRKLMEAFALKEGDVMEWTPNDDGSWTAKKAEGL